MRADRFVALLRGINVGGKNRISMKDLERIFREAGAQEVSTFIQSGNVLYRAEASMQPSIAHRSRERLDAFLGKPIPIVHRSAAEYATALFARPFSLEDGTDSWHLMFLEDEPPPERLDKLDPDRSPGDRYRVVGKHVYLHLPNGAADTKLTNAYFDSKLKTVSTMRNWRTALEIGRLLGSAGA